jgi:uncharacterized membrane protein
VTGVNVKVDTEALKTEVPHIVVGTPGRVLDLATKRNVMDLSKVTNYPVLCVVMFMRQYASLWMLRRATKRTRADAVPYYSWWCVVVLTVSSQPFL